MELINTRGQIRLDLLGCALTLRVLCVVVPRIFRNMHLALVRATQSGY